MKLKLLPIPIVAALLVLSPALCGEKKFENKARIKATRQPARPALKALTKRAYDGNAKAQYALAKMYEEGTEGLPKNIAYALSWYEEAARNGLKLAANRLQHLEEKQ